MNRQIAVALLCWCSALPATAEPWIDYGMLRTLHADKVVTSTDPQGQETWQLDMGDGVTISCSSTGCVGSDTHGAIGCTFSILAELKAITDVCDLPITADERGRLDEVYTRVGRFVADNAVPRQEWRTVEGFVATVGQSYRDDGAAPGQGTCITMAAPDSDVFLMLRGMIDPALDAQLDSFCAQPRLPVMNPCL